VHLVTWGFSTKVEPSVSACAARVAAHAFNLKNGTALEWIKAKA